MKSGKSVVEFFKKTKPKSLDPIEPMDDSDIFIPAYPQDDLRPPKFSDDDEYESNEQQRYRFSKLNPTTVLYEVANRINGKLTRVDPADGRSTPIVLKQTSKGLCTVVFYKSSLQFTIYATDGFDLNSSSKKLVTNRKSIYGLEQAFDMIDKGRYDKVFSEN